MFIEINNQTYYLAPAERHIRRVRLQNMPPLRGSDFLAVGIYKYAAPMALVLRLTARPVPTL